MLISILRNHWNPKGSSASTFTQCGRRRVYVGPCPAFQCESFACVRARERVISVARSEPGISSPRWLICCRQLHSQSQKSTRIADQYFHSTILRRRQLFNPLYSRIFFMDNIHCFLMKYRRHFYLVTQIELLLITSSMCWYIISKLILNLQFYNYTAIG